MRGTLWLVVGPSGVGKDTLMRAGLAARPDLLAPRRVVTRPEGAGGEDVVRVDEAEFARMEAAGAFALSWRAHGLAYGIPAEIEDRLAAGGDVIANVSRTVVDAARARFAPVQVIAVTAGREALAARLSGRRREDAAGIAGRLARAGAAMPEGPDVTVIRNEGPLADAEDAFIAALTRRGGSA